MQRGAGVPRRAQRAADHEEEQGPETADEHDAEEGQGLQAHGGRGVHHAEQRGGEQPAERRQHEAPQRHGGEERLVDGPVDLLGIVGAREARHQHAHAAEHRHDEHDDDDEDLDRDADGGVARVPHEVADEGMIHHALQPADEVLEHRGPGEHPDGAGQRSLDDGAVERPGLARARHGSRARGRSGRCVRPAAASSGRGGTAPRSRAPVRSSRGGSRGTPRRDRGRVRGRARRRAGSPTARSRRD